MAAIPLTGSARSALSLTSWICLKTWKGQWLLAAITIRASSILKMLENAFLSELGLKPKKSCFMLSWLGISTQSDINGTFRCRHQSKSRRLLPDPFHHTGWGFTPGGASCHAPQDPMKGWPELQPEEKSMLYQQELLLWNQSHQLTERASFLTNKHQVAWTCLLPPRSQLPPTHHKAVAYHLLNHKGANHRSSQSLETHKLFNSLGIDSLVFVWLF